MASKKNRISGWVGSLFSVFVLVGIDQITKWLAVMFLKGQESYVLIPGVFELTYLENTGAAFGIFKDKQWLFISAGILICAVLVGFLIKLPRNRQNRPLIVTMLVVLSGAVGNMIDRVMLGYVVDFLYVSLIDFPVFNVADIYVTVGAALFAVFYIRYPEEKNEK